MLLSMTHPSGGAAVQDAAQRAIEAWRREYAGADTLEDALAAYVDEVLVSQQHKRSGLTWVTVAVISKRRPWKSHVYTARLRYHRANGWEVDTLWD